MDSDERLLANFLRGDEGAFEQLVARHQSSIRRLVLGFVRDPAVAEDIAQDAFLRAYQKARSFGGKGSVRGWLYRIAINRAQDELRSRKRKREVSWEDVLDDAPERQSRELSTEELVSRQEFQKYLAGALASMREEHRTPVVLRDVEGMTYEQIAECLGWPLGTVQTRIHRGRLELRGLLSKFLGRGV